MTFERQEHCPNFARHAKVHNRHGKASLFTPTETERTLERILYTSNRFWMHCQDWSHSQQQKRTTDPWCQCVDVSHVYNVPPWCTNPSCQEMSCVLLRSLLTCSTQESMAYSLCFMLGNQTCLCDKVNGFSLACV